MNNSTKIRRLSRATLIAIIASIGVSGSALALKQDDDAMKILQADFKTRNIALVESGDFHLKVGQAVPTHTHSVPVVGYVLKGEIIYQVEGKKKTVLHKGDAFYEPAGARILRFDNASKSEGASFIDFSFRHAGEPANSFKEERNGAIARNTVAVVEISARGTKKIGVIEQNLAPGAVDKFRVTEPLLGIVAEGVVIVREKGKVAQRVGAGQVFSIVNVGSRARIANGSTDMPAKFITFRVL